MVLVQKWPFFQHFFQPIQARKMPFTIFYKEKATFQGIKTRSSKNRKIDIFPKGITHGFGPKMAILATFFLALQAKKSSNKKFKKSKNGHFSNIFFQAIKARKMSFTIFYNVKPTFQAIKTRSLKNRKIIIFSKGLTHGFGPKKAIFSRFFFWAIQARKMSFTIFQNEETSFQAIKTRSLKRRKIGIFPKGLTYGFWSKNGHLSIMFFQAIQARKMSFTIFQN